MPTARHLGRHERSLFQRLMRPRAWHPVQKPKSLTFIFMLAMCQAGRFQGPTGYLAGSLDLRGHRGIQRYWCELRSTTSRSSTTRRDWLPAPTTEVLIENLVLVQKEYDLLGREERVCYRVQLSGLAEAQVQQARLSRTCGS